MNKTAYLAFEGFENELENELGSVNNRFGRLFLVEKKPQTTLWAQNVWLNPQFISFRSISDAARHLKSMQKLWAFFPFSHIRRAMLIASHLPYFSPKPIVFGANIPQAPLGSFTLIDENTMIASPNCSSPFANGEISFAESKIPPSRAYLKLWEFFTLTGRMPKNHETCLELGASPGSWTWVLQSLAKKVIAVDRAPLESSIMTLPNVVFQKRDAFSIKPEELEGIDWVFCDVACYPEKLLEWLHKCLRPDVNFVCTIKLQDGMNPDCIKEFAAIEGSEIRHLCHNKHELTWCRVQKCP